MIDDLAHYGVSLMAVFNPSEGRGLVQSAIAIIIVIGVLGLLFFNIEVPTWLVGMFTFIGGAWLGGQVKDSPVTTRNK